MSSASGIAVNLLHCAVVFLLSVVGGQRFLKGPRDVAALIGSRVQMTCRVDLGNDYLEWIEYTTTSRGKRIFLSFMNNARRTIDAEHPRRERYNIHGSYDLVISNIRLEDAGIYRCRMLLSGAFRDAEIVVISRLKCTDYVTVEQGKTISVHCEVQYNKSSSSDTTPALSWSRGRHRIVGTMVHGDRFVRHTISFVAREEDNGHVYTCRTFFESKPPDYSDQCDVKLNVQSPPRNTRIFPFLREYVPGQVVYCRSKGNPSPTYTWERVYGHGPIRIAGDTLVIMRSMHGNNTYRCVANNTIATIYRGDVMQISFTVKVVSSTVPSTPAWRREGSRVTHHGSHALQPSLSLYLVTMVTIGMATMHIDSIV